MCQTPVKFFMVDFLQNELYQGNVMLVKVNKIRKVKHELRVQIYELRVQTYELRVQIYEL